MKIFQQGRTALACFQRILIVIDPYALIGRQVFVCSLLPVHSKFIDFCVLYFLLTLCHSNPSPQ